MLLGTSNLLLWKILEIGDVLAMGYITTAAHGLFATLQLAAAVVAAPAGRAGRHLVTAAPSNGG